MNTPITSHIVKTRVPEPGQARTLPIRDAAAAHAAAVALAATVGVGPAGARLLPEPQAGSVLHLRRFDLSDPELAWRIDRLSGHSTVRFAGRPIRRLTDIVPGARGHDDMVLQLGLLFGTARVDWAAVDGVVVFEHGPWLVGVHERPMVADIIDTCPDRPLCGLCRRWAAERGIELVGPTDTATASTSWYDWAHLPAPLEPPGAGDARAIVYWDWEDCQDTCGPLADQ